MALVGEGIGGHHVRTPRSVLCCEVPNQDVRVAAALGTVPLHIPTSGWAHLASSGCGAAKAHVSTH